MNTSLTHLPPEKQQEIEAIVKVIVSVAAPEIVMLFGSYATGNWVEDRYRENGVRYEYISDYDFLVVTKGRTEKDYMLADRIVNQSRHLTRVAVNPIVHEIDYVNEGLSIGQYFFTDIIKDGVLLYDTGKVSFSEPKELTQQERQQIANRYFDKWFVSGSEFIVGAQLYYNRKQYNLAAFILHQAAEYFYNTVLLVFTGYKPKTHSLDKLRQYAKPYSKELYTVFPVSTDNEREAHLFDLLKRGYIDARYKHDYQITEEELRALIERVGQMKAVVERICREKIASFGTTHPSQDTK